MQACLHKILGLNIYFFNWGHFKTLQLIVDAQTYFTVRAWQDTSILDQI